MTYKPRDFAVMNILDGAWMYVQSVPYNVTARWVFYRLLQDGTLQTKADYKKLLSYLSRARKGFYKGWHPSTLADDTRAAQVRGGGYDTRDQWIERLAAGASCPLDRWNNQPKYVEVWYEASAMSAQFRHYAHEDISLLAFHGDPSIPEKWKAAARLVERWWRAPKPVTVLYYGDLDEKGLTIPESAREDVEQFACHRVWELLQRDNPTAAIKDLLHSEYEEKAQAFLDDFEFRRIGLNQEHVTQYDIPDNPERPGTYQWEGIPDTGAEELIDVANQYIDHDALDDTIAKENDASREVREKLSELFDNTAGEEDVTDEEFWEDKE